jgi:hypothetical protein
MQEKKLLSIEEIESQTFLALPDRPAMQLGPLGIIALIFNLGGGGGGGGGGAGGSSGG